MQTRVPLHRPRRILTVPNALSVLRLAAIPVFAWLAMTGATGWAVVVLVLGGATDWLDGWLARRLDQVSSLGAVLDPVVDRLWILATLVVLGATGAVPWWFVGAVVLRDVLLWTLVPSLRRRGRSGALPVHVLGKVATAGLLVSFPLLLLAADGPEGAAAPLGLLGWGFAAIGLVAYWWAGLLYARQVRDLVRSEPLAATS